MGDRLGMWLRCRFAHSFSWSGTQPGRSSLLRCSFAPSSPTALSSTATFLNLGTKPTLQTSCVLPPCDITTHPHSPHLTSPFPLSRPATPSTMTANEVNDIVLRLMAAADHIRGREREEILHHVGRLSRAAVRERTAAVDEMQRLRKKIVQQSAELKRIENATGMPAAPVAQASKPSQPPTVSSTGAFHVKSVETDTSVYRAAASRASLKVAFRR